MNTNSEANELRIERTLTAPRQAVWRCWTEPALLEQWFCPKPWFVTGARIDLRPGGEFYTLMNGPDGEKHHNTGQFLQIETERRIVTSDAFTGDWKPSAKPFMVAEMLFSDAPDGATHYIAIARHWNAEDRDAHEKMGFHAGWNAAADQLEELARTL